MTLYDHTSLLQGVLSDEALEEKLNEYKLRYKNRKGLSLEVGHCIFFLYFNVYFFYQIRNVTMIVIICIWNRPTGVNALL